MTTDSTSFVPTPDNSNTFSGYYFVVAWVLVALLIIILVKKSKIAYTIAFFFTIASIIIVLAVGSPTITSIFDKAKIGNK